MPVGMDALRNEISRHSDVCHLLQSCGNHPNLVRMCYLFVDQLPRLAEHINQQRKLWAEGRLESSSPSTRAQLQRDLQAQLEQGDLKPNQVFVLAAYELCRGGDLKKLLGKHKQDQTQEGVSPSWGLPLRRAKMLAFQMLNGLAFLHNEKVSHNSSQLHRVISGCCAHLKPGK